MRGWFTTNTKGRRGFAVLAFVCIALLLVISTAQLVHMHPGGHDDRDCPLCFSAHQTVQAATHFALPVTHIVAAQYVARFFAERPTHNLILLPTNRPPPADHATA